MKALKKISISIVNYNAGEYLIGCLRSLEELKNELEMDIWVVDNASTDGSLENAQKKFPRVNFIANHENLGFTKANNRALKKFKTEFILILNPDIKILPGTLREMVNYLEKNPEVGAASCKVVKEDGTLDLASHRGFPTPWASFLYYFLKNDSLYHLTARSMEKPHEVDAITGAFFLTRKSVLDEVGLFDEDFFMYGEDLDLCFRIKKAGYKIMYVPKVKIIHYKGVTSGIKKHSQQITSATEASKRKAFDSFYRSMKLFYQKHYQRKYPFFINWFIFLGINLKWWLAKRKLTV